MHYKNRMQQSEAKIVLCKSALSWLPKMTWPFCVHLYSLKLLAIVQFFWDQKVIAKRYKVVHTSIQVSPAREDLGFYERGLSVGISLFRWSGIVLHKKTWM